MDKTHKYSSDKLHISPKKVLFESSIHVHGQQREWGSSEKASLLLLFILDFHPTFFGKWSGRDLAVE
jgi:hypothetical protein